MHYNFPYCTVALCYVKVALFPHWVALGMYGCTCTWEITSCLAPQPILGKWVCRLFYHLISVASSMLLNNHYGHTVTLTWCFWTPPLFRYMLYAIICQCQYSTFWSPCPWVVKSMVGSMTHFAFREGNFILKYIPP